MNDSSPVTVTRTWKVALYGSYGEGRSATVYLGTRTVTLTGGRDGRGRRLPLTAQVDGQPAPISEAVGLLEWANVEGRVTLLSEERVVPTIGKPRAARLHRLLSHAGIPSGEHCGFAGAALDRPVFSLAALTEPEARAVWRFLIATHPSAA